MNRSPLLFSRLAHQSARTNILRAQPTPAIRPTLSLRTLNSWKTGGMHGKVLPNETFSVFRNNIFFRKYLSKLYPHRLVSWPYRYFLYVLSASIFGVIYAFHCFQEDINQLLGVDLVWGVIALGVLYWPAKIAFNGAFFWH